MQTCTFLSIYCAYIYVLTFLQKHKSGNCHVDTTETFNVLLMHLKRIYEKKSICNNITKFLVLDETLNDCNLNAVEIQHLYTAFPCKVDIQCIWLTPLKLIQYKVILQLAVMICNCSGTYFLIGDCIFCIFNFLLFCFFVFGQTLV